MDTWGTNWRGSRCGVVASPSGENEGEGVQCSCADGSGSQHGMLGRVWILTRSSSSLDVLETSSMQGACACDPL